MKRSGNAGYRYDEATGLYYCWNRYYDPETYRFITRDIYPGELADPQSMNAYAYCAGDPVNWVDPEGLRIDREGGPGRKSWTGSRRRHHTATQGLGPAKWGYVDNYVQEGGCDGGRAHGRELLFFGWGAGAKIPGSVSNMVGDEWVIPGLYHDGSLGAGPGVSAGGAWWDIENGIWTEPSPIETGTSSPTAAWYYLVIYFYAPEGW